MSKLKVLNLYAGIGGNRKLWDDVEVTAVENVPEIAGVYRELFPVDTVVEADAHQYLLDHHREFDFIWSSPPCPTHSKLNHSLYPRFIRYPDMSLWQEVIFLRQWFKGKWVVENVESYYPALIQPAGFFDRHFFWANFYIPKPNSTGRTHDVSRSEHEELAKGLGIQLPENTKNIKTRRKLLRNAVDPRIGLHILKASQKEVKQEAML